MSKISATATIYRKNKKDNELATIVIRVTYQGKSRYKDTDYRVPVKSWNGEVMKPFPSADFINASVNKQVNHIRKDLMIMAANEITIEKISRYLREGSVKKANQTSFTEFVKTYTADQLSRKEKTEGTATNYLKCLSKFQEFMNKEEVMFEEITVPLLKKYQGWMVKRGNKQNTIWDTLTKFFTKMFREAKRPFPESETEGYGKPQYVKTKPTYLTLEELDKIEAILDELPISEYAAALYFLIECYAGIRHSDWTLFEIEEQNAQLYMKVVETTKNKEPIYLTLKHRPRLLNVLKRAKECPYKTTLHDTNRKLKIIAARAGIKKNLTTHVGRHTFAVISADMGFSKETVSEMMGITTKTAETYYKVTRIKLREEEERLGGL